ncbi:MAG TPA: hypothetical protein VF665_13655 [Longimicrobium sp.]|jgi:hypothetical protein|uniref:hypothetical protein n=1 Tax=Longimicrobium sp. TaxID=2029185 RepID=UPI002ED8FAE2
MRIVIPVLLSAAVLGACARERVASRPSIPQVLLEENFDGEGDGVYQLNYTRFRQWRVTRGSVDLVGTPPFDDFLATEQGLYVDLDGTTEAAGTLESRESFELAPGRYELRILMAGCPRPQQPSNTVIVSLGNVFQETITLPSYAPLQPYRRQITVRRATRGPLRFEHLGGDNYGIFVDDIQLRRL